jgi:hypothetical protein
MKLVEATWNHVIVAAQSGGITETAISRELDSYCALVHTRNKRCSNVELGSHPLEPMQHGISHHIREGKSMDGNKRVTMARLMHGFVATSHVFSNPQRKKHCEMYELALECREKMLRPVRRVHLQGVQTILDQLDGRLIAYIGDFSASTCCSEKHHQYRHYAHHRLQTGSSALEMAFEHTYSVGFKKQIHFTNKSTVTKSEQAATKNWFRTGVKRLSLHAGMRVNDHGRNPPPTSRTAQLVHMTQFDAHVWPDADTERVLKAKAASLNLQFAATSMRITLLNRQLPKGRVDRCVMALLRAEHNGKRQWVDDVRVRYDGADGPCIGFGRCCGFFMDQEEECYVGVQWYRARGCAAARLLMLELLPSYDYVPAGSIRNGALLLPFAVQPQAGRPSKYWILQSHREATERYPVY